MNEQQQLSAVTTLLENLGATPESAPVMANQLVKRARQIAAQESISEADSLQRLLDKIVAARL
jgi:hypothetical protein